MAAVTAGRENSEGKSVKGSGWQEEEEEKGREKGSVGDSEEGLFWGQQRRVVPGDERKRIGAADSAAVPSAPSC